MQTLTEQVYGLLLMILAGWSGGLIFDGFRFIRYRQHLKRKGIFIGDIFYWLLFTVLFLFCIFKANNGEIRSYVCIGVLIGFIIYFKLCHAILWKPICFLINTMIKLIKIFVNIICLPFVILKKIISFPLKSAKKIWNKLPKRRAKDHSDGLTLVEDRQDDDFV